MGRLARWPWRQEAASVVFPDPAGPLSSVTGERCTARDSSVIRRGRWTVAWTSSGGASLELSTGKPERSSSGERGSGGLGSALDSLILALSLVTGFASSPCSVRLPLRRPIDRTLRR